MIPSRKLDRMPEDTALRRIERELVSLERGLRAPGSRLDHLQIAYVQSLLTYIAGRFPDIAADAADDGGDTGSLFSAAGPGRGIDSVDSAAGVRRILNTQRQRILSRLNMQPAEWDLQLPHDTGEYAAAGPLADVRLYLDGIRSPFNLGSIIRTAAAMGIRGLLLAPETVDSEHPRCRRSAMGCRLPLQRMSYDELFCFAEGRELPLAALETGGRSIQVSLQEHDVLRKGCVLLIGSEELGLHPRLLEQAAERITLPLYGAKASLNVGVAAGAALQLLAAVRTGQTGGNPPPDDPVGGAPPGGQPAS